MIWASWQDFFAMGGYALYVWGSVVVCFIAVTGEFWMVSAQWASLKASIRRMHALRKGRDESKA